MAESAIFAPLFSELDCRFVQIAGMFLELGFEALEECDGVGGGTGKTGDDFVAVEAARFSRGVFHDVVAHGDLTVSDEHYFIVFAHAEHGGAVHWRVSRIMRHMDIIAP